jgi:hypothetical protein
VVPTAEPPLVGVFTIHVMRGAADSTARGNQATKNFAALGLAVSWDLFVSQGFDGIHLCGTNGREQPKHNANHQ